MSNQVHEVFRRKGFVRFDSFRKAVRDLTLTDPRGAALTLLACHGSIKRALELLEGRAEEDHPALQMVRGLQEHTEQIWGHLQPQYKGCVLTLDDVMRWRTATGPEQVSGRQLADLRDLFLAFSRVVECMHLLADRFFDERSGRDWTRFITPYLLFTYLMDTDEIAVPVAEVKPQVSVVSDEALNQLLAPLPYQRN